MTKLASAPKARPAAPIAVLTTLVLVASGASAFSSMPPPDSPHDRITAEGARAAGFPEGAIDALQEAVRRPDTDEIEWDPDLDEPARIDAESGYELAHHCDRIEPTSDADAFAETVAYVHEQRLEARHHLNESDGTASVLALGRALHAIQDCYAHSNLVDLPREAQQAAHEVLAQGAATDGRLPIEGLRLAGFDPGADKPGMPDGDPYPHDGKAKDSPDKNDEAKARLPDGRTKYEAAHQLAVNATDAFLRGFMAELAPGQRAMLEDAESRPKPRQFPIPGATPVALLAVAAAFALARRRLPPS